ncbi:MAG: hypothetical protein RIQ56_170 [Candidatus Parcubacteria bacterium]|jgi:hypothetical protein
MAISETPSATRAAKARTYSTVSKLAGILLVVVAETIAIFYVPDVTIERVFAIAGISYAAGVVILAL